MTDIPYLPGGSTAAPGPNIIIMDTNSSKSLIEQDLHSQNIRFVPWSRGKPIPSKCKQFIINVYYKLSIQHPHLHDKDIQQQAADLLGVSPRSIRNIKHELLTTGKLVTAGKERPKGREIRKRTKIYSEHILTSVRQKIHDFLRNGESPTIRMITKTINDDDTLPTFSESTVHRLLRDLNFVYMKTKRQSILVDRSGNGDWKRSSICQTSQFKNPSQTSCVAKPSIPHVQPSVVNVQGEEPLTASVLAAAPPAEQKQMLREHLFPHIQRMHPELAHKVTYMILKTENSEILHMLEHGEFLKAKVEETVAALQTELSKQAADAQSSDK